MCKISVIIPTYGEPKYLEKAIESVIAQTFRDWKLIVVDDNNPNTVYRDKTKDILNKYKNYPNIEYIQHEKNKNGAAARNTGLQYIDSKYVAFLDSDDEYLPTRLEECYQILETNSDFKYAGVYTGCEFRRNGKKYSRYINVESGNFILNVLACNFMFCTGSNIFMKTEVVRKLNGFDESFVRHQDYEFLVRYFEKYELIGIKKVLVIKNNDNLNAPNVEKAIAIKRQYINKYKGIIDKLDKNYIYNCQCIQLGELALSEGKYKFSKSCYTQAKKYGKITLLQNLRRVLLFIKNYKNRKK